MRLHKTVDRYTPASNSPLFLGLGNFDGLHLGHDTLLDLCVKEAKKSKGISAAFTFETHPQSVLHPATKPPMLASAEYKKFLLAEKGLDLCFMIPFTQEFSQIEAESFVTDVLLSKLKASQIRMGYNAHFGYKRKGNTDLMKELSKNHSFSFEKVEPVLYKEEVVSSSRVRELVKEGNFEDAEGCLGKPFRIFGEVVEGDGRGKTLGFPTANLRLCGEVMPSYGVYAIQARVVKIRQESVNQFEEELSYDISDEWKTGVLNFGVRPTVSGEDVTIEVHLLDFEQNLYGAYLEVGFYQKLRGERKFQDLDALKLQIQKDVLEAKNLFRTLAK